MRFVESAKGGSSAPDHRVGYAQSVLYRPGLSVLKAGYVVHAACSLTIGHLCYSIWPGCLRRRCNEPDLLETSSICCPVCPRTSLVRIQPHLLAPNLQYRYRC